MSAKTEGFEWLPDYKDIMSFGKEAEFLTTKEVSDGMGNETSGEMGSGMRNNMSGEMGNGQENEEALPPEMLQQEERHYWDDISYALNMMPFMAREIWAVIDAVLDQYEYSGSPIYVENPDQQTLERITDEIFTQLKYYEERPNVEAPDGTMQKNFYYIPKEENTSYMTPLRTVIFIMLLWNINDRRQRYWRRQRVFAMG